MILAEIVLSWEQSTSGPVITDMDDRVWVQFPVLDIYFSI